MLCSYSLFVQPFLVLVKVSKQKLWYKTSLIFKITPSKHNYVEVKGISSNFYVFILQLMLMSIHPILQHLEKFYCPKMSDQIHFCSDTIVQQRTQKSFHSVSIFCCKMIRSVFVVLAFKASGSYKNDCITFKRQRVLTFLSMVIILNFCLGKYTKGQGVGYSVG